MYVYPESLKQGSFFTVMKPSSEDEIVYLVLNKKTILTSTGEIFIFSLFFGDYKGKIWLLQHESDTVSIEP